MLPIKILFKYWWSGFIDKILSWYHQLTYRPGSKNVVVVGGSWGGYSLAKRLANGVPSGYRVVLVERNEHHHHTFAFPRYSVIGGSEDKVFIPLSNQKPGMWPKGALDIIIGECKNVNEHSRYIELDNGEQIDYEYLAIATGAQLGEPANVQNGFGREDGMAELRRNQKRIEASSKIAVIGAGAVGVELAGDVKSVYPEKHVVLYCSRDQLLVRFPSSVHEQASAELERLGVDIRYKVRPGREGDVIINEDGSRDEYDIVFKCTGERPNSQGFEKFTDGRGYINVNQHLEVVDNNPGGRIYSVGDVNNYDCPKMARSAIAQANVAGDNIKKRASAEDHTKGVSLNTYSPAEVEGALLLTLGLKKSILYLDGKTSNYAVGNWDMDPHYIWDYFNVPRSFGPGFEEEITCEEKSK